MKRIVVLACALVVAGCGGGGRAHGTATLWVTRDRGATVVYAGTVPAGLNGVQMLERKLKVTTRYGGRFVQSIDGVSGSLGSQRDWFFWVNGIEGDRSAADVHLHAGDVLWWDYRHWTGATISIPVVAGAWPEPFLSHGPTTVTGPPALARALRRQVHGIVTTLGARNVVQIGGVSPNMVSISRDGAYFRLRLGLAIATRLAKDPNALRYHF